VKRGGPPAGHGKKERPRAASRGKALCQWMFPGWRPTSQTMCALLCRVVRNPRNGEAKFAHPIQPQGGPFGRCDFSGRPFTRSFPGEGRGYVSKPAPSLDNPPSTRNERECRPWRVAQVKRDTANGGHSFSSRLEECRESESSVLGWRFGRSSAILVRGPVNPRRQASG